MHNSDCLGTALGLLLLNLVVKGCLVCKHTALVLKEYKFRRHHENKGASKCTQSSTKLHADEMAAMKPPYIVKRSIFANKSTKETRLQQSINFRAAHVLAKARQFADSEVTNPRIT